jgi:hypothetical protein
MTAISIKIDDITVKYLKKMTHYLSIERDTDVTLSDIVRESIENTYPLPKKNSEKQKD